MKCSDFVAKYIQSCGVTHVFELSGGMITHLLDSISQTNVAIVSCHHEQAAAFSAEGYARISGIPGIALATSGPGATNLLTAIGSCYFDSVPSVFITGQVNTHELKGSRGIRQLGFQETDIVSMVKPICKYVYQIQTASELPNILEHAFHLSLHGRQGPCLIDIPMNVQSEDIDDDMANIFIQRAFIRCQEAANSYSIEMPEIQLDRYIDRLIYEINNSIRPLILIGGGCSSVLNRELAKAIINFFEIPVVSSLMGVDILPQAHPLRVGFIGSYGNRWANKMLGKSDLLLVLGSRLDIRQTGSNIDSFVEGKKIWQIDIDSSEIGVRLQPHVALNCSVSLFARSLLTSQKQSPYEKPEWLSEIESTRKLYPADNEYNCQPNEINPIKFLQLLSTSSPPNCIYVTDVGQHQMWAAQSIYFENNDRFLTSGGMGAMGFGLPVSIGAAFANSESTVILISGDGSFQLNIQELQTIKRNQLNIKIIIFNNNCHGMVRQFQESYFEGRLQSTSDGYSAPDFIKVGNAYGINSKRINNPLKLSADVKSIFYDSAPLILEVPLSNSSKVYPKLAFGRRFGEMEPEVSPIAMEST